MTESVYIPAQQHFSEQLATLIRQHCAAQMPDLSRVYLFIPNALAARQLREQLIRQAPNGLLGPHIGSLPQWVRQQLTHPDQAQFTPINQQARRLIMIEALNRHPQLFGDTSSWQVCDSLLNLFDELSLQHPQLLSASEAEWIRTLKSAYGLDMDHHRLGHEARIVHTLWQAWQQQMRAMQVSDAIQRYQRRLEQAIERISGQQFYIIGAEQLSHLERAWCDQLATANRVVYVTQQDDSADDLLGAIYDVQQPMDQRLQVFKSCVEHNENPLAVSLFDAANAEQEAQAIAAQTRFWLATQRTSIAIVTEDRKLARRVRALLERAGIMIQDTAGWSLSTTSAASCIERWLECIEEDFAYQPLLDLLKSPFFIADEQREQHLNRVYRLEQDIINHENIPGDLHRYRRALWQRHKRLGHWSADLVKQLNALLDQLQQQAQPLLQLYQSRTPKAAADFLQALLYSIEQLGIRELLEQDMAGAHIMSAINAMQLSLDIANPLMHWREFRTWLASTLEQEQFTPQEQASAVHLMNMKQAEYCRFDALIVAGANRDSLPGNAAQTPFFNQQVKHALGLRNWSDDRDHAFSMFKRFLRAADEVLISYTSEHNGEWLQPSPWVTSLIDFHQLALGRDLHHTGLQQYFDYAGQQQQAVTAPTITPYPGTPLDPALVPQSYSASRYQRLVNCPYQFFAADGLALKPEEAVTRELMKSEYGEKVHLILYAFHSAYPDLPPPFPQPVTTANRAAALHHLVELSQQVFARDIEDNVQHRGWLTRWLQTAPAYIDWLIDHNREWRIHQLEQNLESNIDDHTRIHGRLDRIDISGDRFAIIDYKTGATASQARVDSGEDVQLVSYAKLLDDVQQVAYLKLDRGEARVTASLADDQLQQLRNQSLQRLQALIDSIRQGQALNAWGDSDTCRHCDMYGLCRKQIWENV